MRKGFARRTVFRKLNRMGLLKFVNFSTHLRLKGSIVKIPVLGGVGLANFGNHEPWMDHAIGKLLPLKPGCFMDIGVNLGQTLIKVLTHDRDRPYYGFEPNSMCVAYVERLINVNKLTHARVIPIALSSGETLIPLFLRNDHDVEASITPENRGEHYYGFRRHVPCFSGDRIVADFGIEDISILKIDVEGAELEVLKGCRHLLKEIRPFVLCEILPIFDESTENGRLRRFRTDETLRIFFEAHYATFRIPHNSSLTPLEDIETHGDLKKTDYLFVPSELKHEILAEFRQDSSNSDAISGRSS